MENKRPHLVAEQQQPGSKEEEEENESNTCQICWSKWTTHGEHQLSSLKCGHFFGLACIQRTLRDQGRTSKHCPLCNQPAKDSEVRLHFAVTSISAKDVTKEEDLKTQLNQERAARVQAELQLGKANAKIETLESQIRSLNERLASSVTPEPVHKVMPAPTVVGGGFLPSTIDVTAFKQVRMPVAMGKARSALWISEERGAVAATFIESTKKYKLLSIHPEFPNRSKAPSGGHGHDLPIRDIALQESNAVCYGGTLATASLDGSVSLISSSNLNEVCSFKLQEPIWSVCFLRDDILVAGTVKGRVLHLDPRMPKTAVSAIAVGTEPVHSLITTSAIPGTVCAASFTKLSVAVPATGSCIEITGLRPRLVGDQYVSVVRGYDDSIAVSVKSQSRSFVELGSVVLDKDSYSFRSVGCMSGRHDKPSGRVGYYDPSSVLVPDEAAKSCVLYPSGKTINTGGNTCAGAYYCGSPSLSMLLGTDVVNFVQLN